MRLPSHPPLHRPQEGLRPPPTNHPTMTRRHSNRFAIACLALLLLVAAPTVPMWREWRQRQLDDALLIAVEQNRSIEVDRLLRHGADPNARRHRKLSLWALLMERLHGASHTESAGPTALVVAASDQADYEKQLARGPVSYAATIHQLLIHGANPNAANADGQTPLIFCAMYEDAAQVEELLARGADVNATDNSGTQALQCAADVWGPSANEEGSLKTVEALIRHGAQVNHKDRLGNDALGGAADANRLHVLQMLVEHGADVRAVNSAGFTTLMWMVQHGNTSAVELLLRHGADPFAKDTSGRTCLYWLRGKPHSPMRQLLLKAGAAKIHKR